MTQHNHEPASWTGRFAVWAGAAGFVLGFLVSTLEIWPDFFRRLLFALSGGRGESSYWDEPLFYAAMIGAPWGVVVAFVVLLLACALGWVLRRRNGA